MPSRIIIAFIIVSYALLLINNMSESYFLVSKNKHMWMILVVHVLSYIIRVEIELPISSTTTDMLVG